MTLTTTRTFYAPLPLMIYVIVVVCPHQTFNLGICISNHRYHNEDVEAFWNEIEISFNKEKTNRLQSNITIRTTQCHTNIINTTQTMMESIANDTLDCLPGLNTELPSKTSSQQTKKRLFAEYLEIEPLSNYDKTIAEINSARQKQDALLTDPLCWGVVDLREEKVSPLPKNLRAKDVLSDEKLQWLRNFSSTVIKDEYVLGPSVQAFFEALLLSNIFSLHKIATEKRARGVDGIRLLLDNDSEFDGDRDLLKELLGKTDIFDRDTQFVAKCLDDAYVRFGLLKEEWVRNYGGKDYSERTLDMHLIGPFSRAPNVIFQHSFAFSGENHSDADRDEKSSRSTTPRTGKACDFIFWNNDREVGVGENSGPKTKDHYSKSITDFVDVIKVARAQHMSLQTKCIEESGSNPLPPDVQDSLKLVTIPFFHVIRKKIRFYILLQIDGDLYGIWEWSTHDIPVKDSELISATFLSKKVFNSPQFAT
ncbi:hypothetical protein BC937DRAFT_90880 [Endogone sp. FLAS-F59071]|nr:hypothetical protein BC937DRAFT_90880 [Endogone sp. FLAS-F59071]|eukprot:RUS21965.1 hypothetical protein BC937DRAFT_90880 [Endogone sp. FLAS-F59071]